MSELFYRLRHLTVVAAAAAGTAAAVMREAGDTNATLICLAGCAFLILCSLLLVEE